MKAHVFAQTFLPEEWAPFGIDDLHHLGYVLVNHLHYLAHVLVDHGVAEHTCHRATVAHWQQEWQMKKKRMADARRVCVRPQARSWFQHTLSGAYFLY